LALTNSFFLWGLLRSVLISVKSIKMQPYALRGTHRLTDRQTQTDFIICPMLYVIAIGQIKRTIKKENDKNKK